MSPIPEAAAALVDAPRGDLPEAWSRALHDLYRWAQDEGIPVSGRAAATAPAVAGLRRCPRVRVDFPIRFRVAGESHSFDGLVRDVGFGGLSIESPDCPGLLQRGAQLACAFHLELDEEQYFPVGFRGEVVWSEVPGECESGFSFGVRIVDASPLHASLFDDLVRQALQHEPVLADVG